MMTTRETLEAALVADPDDTALHAAYADLLIEDGDPRGEYIRLSLLAEDRNQPAQQLRGLEQAMFDLRQRHEAEWLGPLARFLERPRARSVAEPMEPNVGITWRRGWIDAIRIGQLNQDLITAIADCPLTRILGELAIEQNIPPGQQPDDDALPTHLDMSPMENANRFAALRTFKLGSFTDGVIASGWELETYLADALRLEEVRVCCDQFASAFLFGKAHPRLHTLHVSGNQYRVPFSLLGFNTRVPNLRTVFIDTETLRMPDGVLGSERRGLDESDFLCLHTPGCLPALEYFTLRDSTIADEGLRLILEAPFFRRLKGLDLQRCNITDTGADLLAAHPHTRKLEYLRLGGNLLSAIGIDALDELGFAVGEQRFGMPLEFDAGFPEDVPPPGGEPR